MSSRISAEAIEKFPGREKPHAKMVAWSNDMEGHSRKCGERYCELANKKVEQFYKVSSLCLDDHQFKQEELESVGELSEVCSQIVLKCMYLARIGRPDILWSVNKLARSVIKWTQACDRRLARLISYFQHTNEFRHYCHVGNTAQHWRLGSFQDSDFAGAFEESKSTSGGVMCIFGSRTYVTTSWICKKCRTVLLALDLWDIVTEVLRSTNNTVSPSHDSTSNWQKKAKGWSINCLKWITYHLHTFFSRWVSVVPFFKTMKLSKSTSHTSKTKEISWSDWWSEQCWFLFPQNVNSSHQEALLYVFEDNEAVIKMIIKGKKLYDETHVQNLQRCAWLIVRQDQVSTQDPNQICRHQKPTRRLANQRKFFRVTNGIIFFVGSTLWVSRCSLAAISVIFFLIRLESGAPWQKVVKRRFQVKAHQWQSRNEQFRRRRDH